MNLSEEINSHYRDSSGQVTIDRDPGDSSTGNGPLHTGHEICLLADLGELDSTDTTTYSRYLDSITVVSGDKVFNGLHFISIWKKQDDNSHDNYIGDFAGSYHARTRHAKDSLNYGLRNQFFYDEKRPDLVFESGSIADTRLNSNHDRFPGQITFYRMCARESVSIYEKLILLIRLISLTLSSNDGDDKIHSYIILSVARRESRVIFGLAWMFWKFYIKKKYGSIGKSWTGYYIPSGSIPHPMTEVDF